MNVAKSAWYEKHRPTTIDDIVFPNKDYQNMANQWIENQKIDGNILLSGAAGTGKTTLSLVLIHSLIKTQADIYRMKTRSVKEIDELQSWITKKPVKSKHNIVYIEEMDKLSREAQTTLKDGMMEKYIDTCVFICCTNHPKKIDKALLTRFTYKLHFDSNNKEAIKKRINNILIAENAKYNPEELEVFVQKHYKKGLRDIINSLQISFIVNNGSVIFKEVEENLNVEESVTQLMVNILKTISKQSDIKQRRMCIISPLNSVIAKEWADFCTITNNNYDVNYDDIFLKMINSTHFLPLQTILAKYAENIDFKKYPDLHLRSCMYELIKCLCEVLP
ncbi:MAG: AAA family ATPase [bacterium]